MLKTFLTNLRKEKAIGATKALSQLQGCGWTAQQEKAISKQFKFTTFEEASNFINRYTLYCHKINHNPQWSNVYNTVNVQLENVEFGKVTIKDIEVADYLDMLYSVKLKEEYEALTLNEVLSLSGADLSIDSIRNNQEERTALYGETKEQLRLA